MLDIQQDVIGLYRKRAGNYDVTANLYYLIGFREWHYRKQAVTALNLKPGDTVIEIGCGTGLNFPLLREAVGPEGEIIGVDLTDAMLAQARQRVQEQNWSNIELVQADASEFQFPQGVDGIISTFALSLVPGSDQVIENGYQALKPGGRWVVLDLQIPSGWQASLTPLVRPIVLPFTPEAVIEQKTWEKIRDSFEKTLDDVRYTEMYLGFAFMLAGERRAA